MTHMVGPDADPLNVRCDACGAEPAEDCFAGCIGKAQHDENELCLVGECDHDAPDAHVLGYTTNEEPKVVVHRKK